jgi:hypothetical protein
MTEPATAGADPRFVLVPGAPRIPTLNEMPASLPPAPPLPDDLAALAARRTFALRYGTEDRAAVLGAAEAARLRAVDVTWRELQARAELAAATADLQALGL